MTNSKIVLLAIVLSVIACVIVETVESVVGAPALFTFAVIITAIAALGAVIIEKQWKFLGACAIACIIIFLSSCSTTRVAPISIETYYRSFGDPRWDDCKDIYDQEYSINIYGDTLETRRIYSLDCYEGRMKTFADQ